jgi:tRNA dimethylallyltransferase
MDRAVIIYGPTAVGKTDFAATLAVQLGGEIINADAAQFYTPLTIGTAKPDWRSAPVPYHLFDICDEPIDYSVARYQAEAQRCIDEVRQRGNMPIFVGGSGFYINALFFPVGEHVKTETAASDSFSWEALNAIDPVRAAAIHPHDSYRISRAITLYQQTNELPSALVPAYRPITQIFLVELSAEPEILQNRIAARTTHMLDTGWLQEAEALMGTPWEQFVLRKKWIGYPELIAYCKAGKPSAEFAAVKDAIIRRTWRYARKQMAYGRMLAKKIKNADAQTPYMKINLTSPSHELYIKQLIDRINTLQKGSGNE